MKLEIQRRLAENLKRLRKERKLTQFELAEKANISEAMIKSVELCLSWPSEKTLTQLAEALEVDILKFFIPSDTTSQMDKKLFCELKDVITRNYNTYLRTMLADLEIRS